jgi:hypothetical protein
VKDLLRVAARVQAFCRKERWSFCLIGGIPVQHWGEPRFTRGIALTVLTGFGSEEEYIAAFLGKYKPRVEDAAQLAREARVLLLEGHGGIDLDVALGALSFEELAVERASDVEMAPGIKLRICSPEDLIVFKSFAGRDLDWHDVETTIIRQGRRTSTGATSSASYGPFARPRVSRSSRRSSNGFAGSCASPLDGRAEGGRVEVFGEGTPWGT